MNKTKRIALLFLVCALLFCGCARPKGVSVKTSKGEYFRHSMVIEASTDRCEWDLSESSVVTFTIGLGTYPYTNTSDDFKARVVIQGVGCTINGAQDCYERTYEDFFANSIYHLTEKNCLIGADERIPQYYETVEIIFPNEDCEGRIDFELHGVLPYTQQVTEAIISYTIENGILVLRGPRDQRS